VDWAPHVDEGEKILYVFDCSDLGTDEQCLQLAGDELGRWECVPLGGLPEYVIPRLARRLTSAH